MGERARFLGMAPIWNSAQPNSMYYSRSPPTRASSCSDQTSLLGFRPVESGTRHPVDDVISRIRQLLGDDIKIDRVWGRGYKLTNPPAAPIPSPSSPSAERLSILGLDRMNLHTAANLRSSARNYEESLKISPDEDAYVNLAMDYINLGHTGFCQEFPTVARVKALRSIEQGISDFPKFSSNYALRGLTYLIYDYDWIRARRDFEKALKLDRNDSYAHLFLGHLEVAQRNFDAGLKHVRQAAELDWRSPMTVFTVPWMLVFAGRADEAVLEADKALRSSGPFAVGHNIHGWALEAAGRVDEAIVAYKKSLGIEFFPSTVAALGHIQARHGNKRAALECLDALHSAVSLKKIAYVSGYHEALIWVGMDDNQRALAALERAREELCDWLIYLKVEPRWEPLRPLKKFARLLRECGID